MSNIQEKTVQKKYNPEIAEEKWYAHWLEQKYFSSKPNKNKEAYTIVIPPPNVTGVLHMGHMLNNTIQDVLIRRARMKGKEACWVPGTDHASIATEAKVVAMLKEKGIDKKTLTRDEFLKYAWEWKEKYGGIILEQLKKLGASCDWDRTKFTMDQAMSDAVIKVFVDLHKKGLIYKGHRMVNWDPQGKTALSDEEVIYKEVQSKLYYIKYFSAENNSTPDIQHLDFFTIATTRPETIMGDVAICVNPNDERYKHLIGKQFLVPIINRPIPIITDEAVDMGFGTGSLKVTPAHDIVDYNIGLKYNLELIDVLTEDGKISEAGQIYVGEDRFAARKKIVKELEEKGYLIESKDIINNIGTSERTDAVIEPRISAQWFVDMKKYMAQNPEVLDSIINDDIKLYPSKFKNTYRHWIENIKDWCISRQLWWGQQIPVWYLPDGGYVVANNKEEALALAKSKVGNDIEMEHLVQDPDVLDTWFSSWLWPISVFDGIANPDNEEIKYYYPTNDLITAPEILFFWVARMIMAGYEFKNEKPFKNVYLTGIVRDKLGRKMSKSLGNSPDPLDLIKLYSADGVRVGMLFSSPAGNDLLFDEKLCEQGRNFTNKIWNALRLVKGWEVKDDLDGSSNQKAIDWFSSKFNQSLHLIEEHFEKYRLSDALHCIYKLVWEDFCAWYLEMVKPHYEKPIDKHTYQATLSFFENILKVVHPFMPFITEELWHEIKERKPNEDLIVAQWPNCNNYDTQLLEQSEIVLELITQLRNLKAAYKLAKHEPIKLYIKSQMPQLFTTFYGIIERLTVANNIFITQEAIPNSPSFVIGADEFFVPMELEIDVEKEIASLTKDIEYSKGFLLSVEAKLNNEKFMSSAPEKVKDLERKKQADTLAKLKTLEESLNKLLSQ